jgi:MFS family permease
MGLLPDGDSSIDLNGTDHQEIQNKTVLGPSFIRKESNLIETFKTARFWYIILYPASTTFGVYIIIVHHVRYLADLGVDKLWAASLLAAIGALSAGFRFFWGWFSDRVGREITFTLGGGCFSSGILFLLLFQYFPLFIFLYLFAIFFGAGWGVTAPMFMSITGDLYKGKNFGLIYGMVEGCIGLGSGFGAWVAGYIFDRTQNYFWAFVFAILLNLISILLVWLAAPRKLQRAHSLPF